MDRALLRPLLLIALAAAVFVRCARFGSWRVALAAAALGLALALCLRPGGRRELACWIAALTLCATALDYALQPAAASPLFALALGCVVRRKSLPLADGFITGY
jgi:hypothetical protein